MNPGYHDEEVLGKVYDMQLIRRLWPYLSPHRALIALSLLLIPIRSVLEALPGPLLALCRTHSIDRQPCPLARNRGGYFRSIH